MILVQILHLGVHGGVVSHCFGEFLCVAVADCIRGCQYLQEMCFPRGGERHCWLVLVSMKAIGLRARAACNEAVCSGNDGEWSRRESGGVKGLATPISQQN